MTEPAEKKHAKFSASGSSRWLNCPGSIALSETCPPRPETAYSREGTTAHLVLEAFLSNPERQLSIEAELGKIHPKTMVKHALFAAREIWKVKSSLKGSRLLAETSVRLDFVQPGMHGTVDAAVLEDFGELHVFDFKYGAGYMVSPENNTQLLYYALGLAHQEGYNFSKVILTIIQPRAHDEAEKVRSWAISMDELVSWTEKFKAGVAACEDPLAPYKPGEWCKFCPAQPVCPGLSSQAIEQAQLDFQTQTEPSVNVVTLPTPGDLTNERLALALQAAPKLNLWLEALAEEAEARIKLKQDVPGFKLVWKRPQRKWIDPDAVYREVRKKWGNKFFRMELFSPSELSKIRGMENWIAQKTQTVSSGLTLAADSDPRPAADDILRDLAAPPAKAPSPETAEVAGKPVDSFRAEVGHPVKDVKKLEKEIQQRKNAKTKKKAKK